jgi:hypothetical protein
MIKHLNAATILIVACLQLTASSPVHAEKKAASQPTQSITLSSDPTVQLIMNGKPYNFVVDPDGPGTRVINKAPAQQLMLKPGLMGFSHRVGPTIIRASSDGVMINYGALIKKDRVLWFDRDATSRGDGIMGPSALPYNVVTYKLSTQQNGEKLTTLPMAKLGAFGISGAGTMITVGQQNVIVRFTLGRDMPLATAPTGQIIADAQGGRLTGETLPTMIRFGVNRPTRTMVLSQPLTVGGRRVDNIAVRVSDFGDASTIKDANATAKKVDEDEIIVTAQNKKKKTHELVLGKSFLNGCSSLTYDFKKKQIVLSCL